MSKDGIYSLADLKDSFIYRTTDMSGISLQEFSQKYIEENSFDNKEMVETVAYAFYFMEHTLSEIEKQYASEQELPDGMREVVIESLSLYESIFTLCFSYVFSIVSRESRHLFNEADGDLFLYNGNINFDSRLGISGRTLLGNEVMRDCLNFTSCIGNYSSKDLRRGGFGIKNKAPDITIFTYLKYLEFIFNNAEWDEGYGGNTWGDITLVLRELVTGKISPKIFIDTVWSLEHNNGCIFNKDTVFEELDGPSDLYFVLQAQASGIIPHMINQENYNLSDPRRESSYNNKGSNSLKKQFMQSFRIVEIFFPKMFDFNMSESDFTEILEE